VPTNRAKDSIDRKTRFFEVNRSDKKLRRFFLLDGPADALTGR